jgi:hypothetical protein
VSFLAWSASGRVWLTFRGLDSWISSWGSIARDEIDPLRDFIGIYYFTTMWDDRLAVRYTFFRLFRDVPMNHLNYQGNLSSRHLSSRHSLNQTEKFWNLKDGKWRRSQSRKGKLGISRKSPFKSEDNSQRTFSNRGVK